MEPPYHASTSTLLHFTLASRVGSSLHRGPILPHIRSLLLMVMNIWYPLLAHQPKDKILVGLHPTPQDIIEVEVLE